MSKDKVEITPDTKVAVLLQHYPELEETLIRLSPSFAALKNPVLRRTVAKVTALQQAAKVANVNVIDMVNTLRKAVGMPLLGENFCPDSEELSIPFSAQPPATVITTVLDVRPVIEAGEHPKEMVLAKADELKQGQCMELLSPFTPTPLIDLLRKRGFKITLLAPQDGIVRTFVER